MAKKHKPEEIVANLRQVDVLTSALEDFVRRYRKSSEAEYARWRIDSLKQQVAVATPPPSPVSPSGPPSATRPAPSLDNEAQREANARLPDAFRRFLEALRPEARMLDISSVTFDSALRDVEPDLALPDLVLPGKAPDPCTAARYCSR